MSEQPDLSLWHGPDNTNRIEIPVVLSVSDPEIEDVEAVVVVNKDGSDQMKIDPADAISLYGQDDITVTPVEYDELPVAEPVQQPEPKKGFWSRLFGR